LKRTVIEEMNRWDINVF